MTYKEAVEIIRQNGSKRDEANITRHNKMWAIKLARVLLKGLKRKSK